jgi:hypothetical protein
MRDRETIVDKKYHREAWKTVGEPGAALADGKIVGIWRPRKGGRKLTVTVKTFSSPSASDKHALQIAAEQIAPLRGASLAAVDFETY